MTTTDISTEATPETNGALFAGAHEHARQRRIKVVVLGIFASVVVVGAAAIGAVTMQRNVPGIVSGPLASAPCFGSQLYGSVEGSTSGAGSFGVLISMKYLGSKACMMSGFPALTQVVNGTTTALPYDTTPTSRTGLAVGLVEEAVLPKFNLEPGHQVSFWIEGSDEQAGLGGSCHSYNALSIAVGGSPAHGSIPSLNAEITACGNLWVTPLVPGRTGFFPAKRIPLAR